jgi:formate dehydrogenase major subunit
MILWGMGISQHVHGTDNARCLIALCLMTGQVGKPGTGLHPLRGQNNVQGASDSGLIPMMYPGLPAREHAEAKQRFEKSGGQPLDTKPASPWSRSVNAAYDGKIRGMYVMGENPAMSDPDVDHARAAMAKLEHMVVQDIFLTETAYLADVVLPATAWPEKDGTVTNTDRMVQLGRKAVEPPGEARPTCWITSSWRSGLGLDWKYQHPKDVLTRCASAWTRSGHHLGAPGARLDGDLPVRERGRPGHTGGVHHHFPNAHRARQVRAGRHLPAAEQPDASYAMVLIYRPPARATGTAGR